MVSSNIVVIKYKFWVLGFKLLVYPIELCSLKRLNLFFWASVSSFEEGNNGVYYMNYLEHEVRLYARAK